MRKVGNVRNSDQEQAVHSDEYLGENLVGTQSLIRVGRRIGAALLATGCLLPAAACSQGSNCGSGAESGEAAVSGLLTAAFDGSDSAEVCRYIQEGDDTESAGTWARGLEGDIEAAGGVEKLTITERTGDQMGSEHRFEVRSGSTLIADVAVIERDGRFVLAVESSTP